MCRQLLVTCILLAIAADLLEAKYAAYHKKNDHRSVKRILSHMKRQDGTCSEDHFQCENLSRCIPNRWLCDGDNDCGDRSDEPDDCLTRECPEGHVKCPTGQCLEVTAYCTRNLQCPRQQSAITPVDCPPAECEPDQFTCAGFTKCVQKSYICDTDNDCGDNSDEQNCDERVCGDDEIRCNNGQCISKSNYCGSSWGGCRDGTDLSTVCLDVVCPEGYLKCVSDGKCYYNSSRCDEYNNCADGSDELNCPPVQCEPEYSRCPGRNRCVRSRYFCDTDNDCGDNSDESPAMCNGRLCDASEVRCSNGQCLDAEAFCRGEYSCRDSSLSRDEVPACGSQGANVPDFEPVEPMPQLPPEASCAMHVFTTCGEPSMFEQLGSPSQPDAVSKLAEIELSELCSSVIEWRDCALPAYEGNDDCKAAEVQDPKVRPLIETAVKLLDFVCVQHIEVINRAKGCLLKSDEQGRPIMMFMVAMSCMQHMQEPGGFRPPLCVSTELQQCAKNVIATECDNDIATVADELANLVQEQLCSIPTALVPPSLKKRHYKDVQMLRKLLQSFF